MPVKPYIDGLSLNNNIYSPVGGRFGSVGEGLRNVAEGLNSLSVAIKRVEEKSKKFDLYNLETKVKVDLANISAKAKTELWSPDEYKNKIDQYYKRLKLKDEEQKAVISRIVEFEKTKTGIDLLQKQTQEKIESVLVNTVNYLDTLNSQVVDAETYRDAVLKAQDTISSLEQKKILNPLKARDIFEKAKEQFKTSALASVLEKNPYAIVRNIKEYSWLYKNNKEKMDLLNLAKTRLKQIEAENEARERKFKAEVLAKYSVQIINGEVGYSDIVKDPNIPNDVKSKLLMFADSKIGSKPSSLALFGVLKEDIIKGKIKSLEDFQDRVLPLLENKKISSQMFNQLQNLVLQKEAIEGKTRNGLTSSTMSNKFRLKIQSFYSNIIPGIVDSYVNVLKDANKDVFTIDQGKFTFENKKKEIASVAKVVFSDMLNEMASKGVDVENIPRTKLLTLAQKAVVQASLQPVKEDFDNLNQNIFDSSNIEDLSKKLNLNQEELETKLKDFIFKYIVENKKINKFNYLSIDKILHGEPLIFDLNIKKDDGSIIPLNIEISGDGINIKPYNPKIQ